MLDRFQVKLLTEGSGTQIFSTTFAQWAARETLRRAQPLTLLVRFAPRQRQKPMNELLSANQPNAELDPAGSLVDADMGSYYTYLNQQRLTGAEKSSFLVWFEGHKRSAGDRPGDAGRHRIVQSNRPQAVAQLDQLAAVWVRALLPAAFLILVYLALFLPTLKSKSIQKAAGEGARPHRHNYFDSTATP